VLGFAFTRATRSATVMMPESERTTSTFGALTSSEIGAKSLTGSYGRLLNSAVFTAIAVEVISSV